MKKIIILLLFPFLAYSQAPDSLVGVWQDNENLGSGWSNSFLFFKDGTYKFFVSQMDCSKRLVSYSGKWKVSDVEDAVYLTVEARRIISGGIMQKSDGSCASDSMLTGGSQVNQEVSPAEKLDYAVSRVYSSETGGLTRKFIYIDAIKYWYFGDPAEMRKQFEGE